ncbi:MAG: hypothetical protein IH594_15270 [Bacteroidales bacterium]|nr:hypothetical protein [Bacteroidales bacterium]
MPANLNALIRYITINSCLYGGRRHWSIDELIDACTASLAEATGRYKRVSERTIRDDIRILRSDILGFNAPIRQKEGLYFYDDHRFSIATLALTDSGLIERLIRMLLDLRRKVKHPELERIILQMLPLASPEFIHKIDIKDVVLLQSESNISEQHYNYNHINWRLSRHFEDSLEDLSPEKDLSINTFSRPDSDITWGRIFSLIPRHCSHR